MPEPKDTIELKDRKVGDTFTVDGDNRIFKVMEAGATSSMNSKCRFCVYALSDEAEMEGVLRWRLDYENAKTLIENYNLVVEYSRITLAPIDNIYLSQEMRKETGCFRPTGPRYIAEAAIRNGSLSIVRTASAGADNVSWNFMTWAPDIACKRAIIKCVIDSLNLPKIDPEIVPARMKVKDAASPMVDPKLIDRLPGFKPADKNQIAAIKALLKKRKVKLSALVAKLNLGDVTTLQDLGVRGAEATIKELQK